MSYNIGDWIWANQADQTINTSSIGLTMSTFSNGESIIGGNFKASSHFDNITLSASNTNHAYVAKIDNLGNWVWAKQISNTYNSSVNAVKTKDDYAIVTGYYQGDIDFDNITLSGDSSTNKSFIAKIDLSGNWIWVTAPTSGTGNYSYNTVVEIADDGSVIVGGTFYDEITFGNTTLTGTGYFTGYIAKLDSTGNNWLWATKISSDYVGIYTIGLLSNQDIVIGGDFSPDATFDNITIINTSNYDITYIAKLDSSGNWLSAITFDDNNISENLCNNLSVLSDDSIIITGSYDDSITVGNTTLPNTGHFNIYVSKLDANNNWLWCISASGENNSDSYAIKSLSSGSSIIGGFFNTSLTCGTTTLTTDTTNLFVAKINKNGEWEWAYSPVVSTQHNFSGYYNIAYSLDIYNNNVIIAGPIRDSITFGEITLTSDFGNSVYVAKMYIGTEPNNIPNQLAVTVINTQNSILVNKNAIIKELYDIHNLKKYKLNYLLK